MEGCGDGKVAVTRTLPKRVRQGKSSCQKPSNSHAGIH